MKRLVAVLFLLKVSFSFSQQVVIANLKENTVILGVDNPLAASVAGYPCNAVVLTTNNGKIEKTGCGYFNYHPAELGLVAIKVWVRNGKKSKLMGTVPYRVHSLPLPVASIGFNKGGFISLKFLKLQGGVIARLLNSDFDAPFTVKAYTATGMRDTTVLFSNRNTGAIYNDSLKSNLDLLKTGDGFLVSKIICAGPDGIDREIVPMEFYIKD